jgi:hypothetical protein
MVSSKTEVRLAFAIALAACATHVEAPRAPPILDVAISFVPAPTINLGGTKALLDTGATVHAVRKSGGPSRARILDAHGAPMDAEKLGASPVPGIGGPWFGVPGLPVAAVVSPQAMLAPGQAIELDMRLGHVRLFDDPQTAAAMVVRTTQRASPGRCANGTLWVVDATLGGHGVRLLVDSGSARTSLLKKSPTTPAFRKWRNYPATIPDPTGNHSAWVVLDVPISVAGLETSLDLVVSDDPDEPCDVDGTLGMDVLRRCDIVLMRASAGLTCG